MGLDLKKNVVAAMTKVTMNTELIKVEQDGLRGLAFNTKDPTVSKIFGFMTSEPNVARILADEFTKIAKQLETHSSHRPNCS